MIAETRVGRIMHFFAKFEENEWFPWPNCPLNTNSRKKNWLRWCFPSVNPKNSKWRPKTSIFWHRQPLNDPPLHRMCYFFCFQGSRILIYRCIRCRCYSFLVSCSLTVFDVCFVDFPLVFSGLGSIFIVLQVCYCMYRVFQKSWAHFIIDYLENH